MTISRKDRISFVIISTLLSNLIPLLGLLLLNWSPFSVLLLYWIEGIFIIIKGKAHFFLVANIGRGSRLKNALIKVFLSLFSFAFILGVLLFQSWLIFVSVRQTYAPNYPIPAFGDVWASIKVFFYLLFNIIPLHIGKEPLFLFGLILSLLNYVVMFFYIRLGIFKMSIVGRYWRSLITVMVLTLLNWWMMGDADNPQALDFTFKITLGFILAKLIFEQFPYIWRKRRRR